MNNTKKALPVQMPIECNLEADALQARIAAIRTALGSQIETHGFIENGYQLSFPLSEATLAQVTTFMWQESQCCAFLSFQLCLPSGKNQIALSILGTGEMASFVPALFGLENA